MTNGNGNCWNHGFGTRHAPFAGQTGRAQIQGLYILPLIFTKRPREVFDDELNRIAKGVGSRAKAFTLQFFSAAELRERKGLLLVS
jgi:hypothetical protein